MPFYDIIAFHMLDMIVGVHFSKQMYMVMTFGENGFSY